ncbi:hypothetical protein [Rhodanobacter sp. Soil772]|uniref:hypothetical protein n=1 Tax=Rhodanobacter sp. Soil772 TaxID=1736406 RepID=UPI0012FA50A0|nr:hypothetical protein [Rhodanobacter sp. Soil772]
MSISFFSAAARATLIVALTWGVAACSPGESYTGSSAPAAPAKAASTATGSALMAAGVKLQSEPAVLEQCGALRGKRAAVKVSWDATTARVNTVKIWVQDPSKEPKLWAATGAAGSKVSGAWMTDGSAFILTDAGGRQLARLVMRAASCG